MTKLRKGDTVLIRATVTDVSPFGEDQQIMVTFGPKAESNFGWLVPGEYDFKLDVAQIRVGDRVKIEGELWGEVKAIVPPDRLVPGAVWVKPDGRFDMRTLPFVGLRRAG